MASSPTPTSTPTSTPEPAPAEPDCAVAAPFPDAIQRWCALISEWSARRDLDPNLIAALILVESGGRESAISRSGAVGLMQVMPRDGIAAGFMCPNGPCFANRPTTEELLDPAFNIEYGTGMLAGLIGRYGERDGLKRYGPARGDYSYVNLIYNTMQKYADRWWWLWPLH